MKNLLVYTALFCGILLTACQQKEINNRLTLDDCPVVAHRVVTGSDTLIVCDVSLVKDTFNISLTSLLSSFEIVHLENSPEALMMRDGACCAISENYIGIMSSMDEGYKLYNKEGKYLKTISSQGQGPDEYWVSIYDSHIDEPNNRIYLLSYRASKVLVFDLEGNPQKHIPLSYVVHKGRFIVDPEKEILFMMAIPFIDTPSAIWLQDFQGNILQEYPSTQFVIEPGDYSNDINFTFNTPALAYSLLHADPAIRLDTLYHYDRQRNRIKSVFTADLKEYRIHDYVELSHHYLIRFFKHVMPGEEPRPDAIIIDKKTLRGCNVQFKLSILGKINVPFSLATSFDRGHYLDNIYPHELKEELSQALLRKDKLAPEVYERVKTLYDKIGDDDNNILFIGKLKTEE
jgi:hypothetical protein